MSEKLDGVRAYWDGHNFYSRNGNQFPAPDWFKEHMPSCELDGELWAGRRQFRRCLGVTTLQMQSVNLKLVVRMVVWSL